MGLTLCVCVCVCVCVCIRTSECGGQSSIVRGRSCDNGYSSEGGVLRLVVGKEVGCGCVARVHEGDACPHLIPEHVADTVPWPSP